MFQDLIDFIEESSIEDVRQMLKDNGVKFKSDVSKKYDNIIKKGNKSSYCYEDVYKKFKIHECELIPITVIVDMNYCQADVIDINEERYVSS